MISSTKESSSFVRSSVETVGFGVVSSEVIGVFPGVTGVFVVVSFVTVSVLVGGAISAQEVVTAGACVTGALSSAVDRIKVQLVSVREKIARGRKSERFIVLRIRKKDE